MKQCTSLCPKIYAPHFMLCTLPKFLIFSSYPSSPKQHPSHLYLPQTSTIIAPHLHPKTTTTIQCQFYIAPNSTPHCHPTNHYRHMHYYDPRTFMMHQTNHCTTPPHIFSDWVICNAICNTFVCITNYSIHNYIGVLRCNGR